MENTIHKRKAESLGMSMSTARSRLYQQLVFNLVKQLKQNVCFRCKQEIACAADFSVDHIEEWLHKSNATELFFDLNNVAFSHRSCNSGSRRCRHVAGGATGFKGVTTDTSRKRRKKYHATITVKNKRQNLGRYLTAQEAAIVYDTAAIQNFGKRAITNKMLGLV